MESNQTEESALSKFGTRSVNVIVSLFSCAIFLVIGSWIPMIMPREKAGQMAIMIISADHQGKPVGTDINLPKKSSINPLRAMMNIDEEINTKTGLTSAQYQSILKQPPRFMIDSSGIMIGIGSKYLALLRSNYLFDFCIVQFVLLVLAIFSLGEVIVNIWLLLK